VDLLSFDVSGAASYFGTAAPSQRRDRKSGSTKRKQTDIERERLMVLAENAADARI
jgi:DNA (cytosine-5)-methyltransferase 1